MKKITRKTKVVSSIDTIQTKEDRDNRELDVDFLQGQTMKYTNDYKIVTRWSPNHDFIKTKLSDTEKEMDIMFKRATVKDKSKVRMNRIDINTDVDIAFEDVSKIVDFMFMCCTEGMQKERKEWTNKDTLKKEAYWFSNQYLEINFYDKAKEDSDKEKINEYPTRLEVRFKKIKSQDKKHHIEKAINFYDGALERYSFAERSRMELLCNEWDKFIEENPRGTLTHFVVKFEEHIYTREILKGIYEYVGLKGNFKAWVDKFRRGYKLDLISENEIKELVKRITISLKKYKNN